MFRIVIVDDHPSTREGLATRIEIENDLEVCGVAADALEGLAAIEKHLPDLAIVDVSLKSGSGIDLTKKIRQQFGSVKVLVWSMYDESLYGDRAMRAGAMGYINKELATDAIIRAITTVLNGDSFFSPELSSRFYRRLLSGDQASNVSPTQKLSERELETFRLIGNGCKTADIAAKLSISPKTVETYRARIKEKLSLKDMAELAREAAHWVLENG
ncbi:MAG: response regulator transcription factor [Mariniblastus sp.]|nr:response regulator transcription factor [Mariniblastus sp.]